MINDFLENPGKIRPQPPRPCRLAFRQSLATARLARSEAISCDLAILTEAQAEPIGNGGRSGCSRSPLAVTLDAMKPKTRPCFWCDQPFLTAKPDHEFCSSKCRAASWRADRSARGLSTRRRPAPAVRALLRRCELCGVKLPATARADARWCGGACRVAAHRAKQREAAKQTAELLESTVIMSVIAVG